MCSCARWSVRWAHMLVGVSEKRILHVCPSFVPIYFCCETFTKWLTVLCVSFTPSSPDTVFHRCALVPASPATPSFCHPLEFVIVHLCLPCASHGTAVCFSSFLATRLLSPQYSAAALVTASNRTARQKTTLLVWFPFCRYHGFDR